MTALVPKIELPPLLIPVFLGKADIRWAAGGRGAGKSWAFHKMAAVKGAMLDQEGKTGVILCIRQFMNSLDDSSLLDVKSAIESDEWLTSVYEVGEKYVRTKSGRIKFIFAGTNINIGSIKSKSKIRLCVAEEAEQIPASAWEKIIPTIREEDSELWAVYNPESDKAWVHENLRMSKDPLVKGTMINWDGNPWFTDKMNRDRLRSLENDPDNYAHVWEGAFKTHFKGSYYAASLSKAREENRVGVVAADPLLPIKLFWDIGGTGARADACTIWAVQFVGHQIRFLKYYEAVGQPLAAHVAWLRSQGYGPERAGIILPHDGRTNDRVHDVSYESALTEAGYDVTVVPNQGKGAAMFRIEAARRGFDQCWFDEAGCEGGLEAVGAYHERRDEARNIGLGPEHDWASHGADSFGLVFIVYEEPRVNRTAERIRPHVGHGGWA